MGVIHEGSLLRGRECCGIYGGSAPEPRTWRNAREINWILTVWASWGPLGRPSGSIGGLGDTQMQSAAPRAWPLLAGPGSLGGWLVLAAVCMGRSCKWTRTPGAFVRGGVGRVLHPFAWGAHANGPEPLTRPSVGVGQFRRPFAWGAHANGRRHVGAELTRGWPSPAAICMGRPCKWPLDPIVAQAPSFGPGLGGIMGGGEQSHTPGDPQRGRRILASRARTQRNLHEFWFRVREFGVIYVVPRSCG